MALSVIRRRLEVIRLAIRVYRRFKRAGQLQTRGRGNEEVDRLYCAAGRDIRITASRMCGAIVKAGQFLSLREELFGAAFTRELQQLQDHVPPASIDDIKDAMTKAYGQPLESVYHHIDGVPIASGSIAQVHRAKTRNGRTVAIKVLRPGIEHVVAIDLSSLRFVARLVSRIPAVRNRMDFVALHETFARTLSLELDMQAEVRHMERLRKDLAEDERIVIPKVLENNPTTRVLVMELIEGANISDARQLQSWHIDAYVLRDALLDAYLKQLLVTGFVHLDPHPGNLAVRPDGKLALLDFGMVAKYSSEERALFRSLIQRAFFHDIEGVASILQRLGYLTPGTDLKEFAHHFESLIRDFNATTLHSLFREQGFRLEAKYMLLIRCLGMLKTSLMTLTPDEDDWPSVLSDHVMPILLGEMDTSHLSSGTPYNVAQELHP